MTKPHIVDPVAWREPDGRPVGARDFTHAMARLGPFEAQPRLAVGVSGGADSLALALLAHRWAAKRGGTVTALTVNHRLRPESAAEARYVGEWLSARGIPHHTLVWRNPPKGAGLQAAARQARLRLLGGWCRWAGVLHLLLAHQREDQAETFLARLASGSGVDGLAGMPRTRVLGSGEGGGVRVLRPLLDVPAADLRASLVAAGQSWIDDPSNRDPRFARGRLARVREPLAAEGLSVARLARTAARAGRDRSALEHALAVFLADHARLAPAGHAWLAGSPWQQVPDAILVRALARLIGVVGGHESVPPLGGVEALVAMLRARDGGRARTLGGCRVLPRSGGLMILREAGRISDAVTLKPGSAARWDGRFDVRLSSGAPHPVRVSRLTQADLVALRRAGAREARSADGGAATAALAVLEAVPAAVRGTLPVFQGLDGRLTVPHLGYRRPGNAAGIARFCPPLAAMPAPFEPAAR